MKRFVVLLALALSAKAETWKLSNIDILGDVGRYASIATQFGKTHVAYYDLSNHDLKYASTTDNVTWTIEVVDCLGDGVGSVGWGSSIALDKNGFVHISYNDNAANTLRYATNSSGLWVATTVDNSGNVAVPTSIAIDSLNQPHIAYLGGGLKYAHKVGGAWMTEMVDSTIGFAEWPMSIKMAAGDFADISYYDGTNFDLKLARQMTNNAWNFTVIDSDTAGEYSSLAIDSAGVLRIAYFNSGHQDLRYAINQ